MASISLVRRLLFLTVGTAVGAAAPAQAQYLELIEDFDEDGGLYRIILGAEVGQTVIIDAFAVDNNFTTEAFIDFSNDLPAFTNVQGWDGQALTREAWDAGFSFGYGANPEGDFFSFNTAAVPFDTLFDAGATRANLYWSTAYFSTAVAASNGRVERYEGFRFDPGILQSDIVPFGYQLGDPAVGTGTLSVLSIPEPATAGLLAAGLAGVVSRRRGAPAR